MRKLLFLGLVGLILLVIGAACAKKEPAKPVAPAAPAKPAVETAKVMTPIGAPGAIYRGKLEDLVGPAPHKDLGDDDGGVTLGALQRHKWLFENDYYKKLVEKARFDNPTPLVTKGKNFKFQFACINRTLLPCKLMEHYFAPNVLKRTEGQLEITMIGYPELNIQGPEALRLVTDRTIPFMHIYGGFVAGDLPLLEIQYLWGVFPSDEVQYKVVTALIPEIDRLVRERTGGVVVQHEWFSGVQQFFFCKKPITKLEDFKGVKARSHGTALSDWIEGMGATAQFVAFAEVYTALERGVIDCGVSGALPAYGLRWYEVSKYLVGPLITFQSTNSVMNKAAWASLPPDFQQILLEEGAKNELEALRIAPAQNEAGVPRLLAKGMQLLEFSPEMRAREKEVALKRVIPNWVKRTGGPTSEAVKIYNEKAAPILGVVIDPDGSARVVAK